MTALPGRHASGRYCAATRRHALHILCAVITALAVLDVLLAAWILHQHAHDTAGLLLAGVPLLILVSLLAWYYAGVDTQPTRRAGRHALQRLVNQREDHQ